MQPVQSFILHASLIDGIGPATIQQIVRAISASYDFTQLHTFSMADWMTICSLSQPIAQKLVRGLADKRIFETELALIQKHDVTLYFVTQNEYPLLLHTIDVPPAVLYAQGSLPDTTLTLAVIGSRAAGAYASSTINMLIPPLVNAGCAIISGGAIGADGMAHEATLAANGKTVAVIGSGLVQPYPRMHKKLFERIVAHDGALLSIFPMQMPAMPGNFPARNRIIAGLSRGCLVVQAAQKSGTSITAKYALDQGREVFAIPGLISDPLSVGCHRLIQEGAKLVTSVEDILIEFGCCDTQTQKKPIENVAQSMVASSNVLENKSLQQDDCLQELSDICKRILVICKNPSTMQDILEQSNESMSVVQTALFELQMNAFVQQDLAGRWSSGLL